MIYGYNKIPLSETIRGYEKVGNYLEVEMLNGKVYLFDYDLDKEEKILKIMEDQAIDRKQSFEINNLYKLKTRLKIYNALAFIGYIALLNVTDIKLIKIFATILAVGLTVVICFANIAVNDHINELTKYDIFLDIKEKLKESPVNNYMDNIKIKKNREKNININNLDKYSLKEVEEIKAKIKSII